MKIKVEKSILTEVLKKTVKVIDSKADIPILSGVHLVADFEGLTVTGCDSELAIRVFVPNGEGVEIEEAGNIVLPAKEFSNIVKSMPENIEITCEDLKSTINSGRATFQLSGMNGDEYPRLPKVEGDGFTIQGGELKELINKTLYATSEIETRPILTGVNTFFEGNNIVMIATDSYRLARVVGGNVENGMREENIVIPQKTLNELARIIDDSEEVKIQHQNNKVLFKTGDIIIFSRLLDGKYPETDRLMPEGYSTLLVIDRKALLSALERSSILADDIPVVTMTINNENEGIFPTIELSYKDSELGHSKEEVVVEKIEGQELKLAFNAKFLMEALKVMDGNKVRIEFKCPLIII